MPSGTKALVLLLAALTCVSLVSTSDAHAEDPFVVLADDGSLEANDFETGRQVGLGFDKVLRLYNASGAVRPEVLSVWFAFDMGTEPVQTRYAPYANDVTGIGLEHYFGDGANPSGTFPSTVRPIRCVLLHNNFLALEDRARFQNAEPASFHRYLFLLELSHLWGPALRVPGAEPLRLTGFDFHWSFWMDAGGSPAGGNPWTDNGDGTFTVTRANGAMPRFSMLDLYVMGLAQASEVPPFHLLSPTSIPADAIDPFTGREVDAATFPWFSATPLTVSATRETFTIDDVIATNGARTPAFGAAPTSMSLGIVLVVPAGSTPDQIADYRAEFAPLAADLAPAYADATRGRGTLNVVTSSSAAPPLDADAGVIDADGGVPANDAAFHADAGADPRRSGGDGCSTTGGPSAGYSYVVGLLMLITARRRRWLDPSSCSTYSAGASSAGRLRAATRQRGVWGASGTTAMTRGDEV